MTLISRETFGVTDAYGLPIPVWLMDGGRFPSASSAASYLRIVSVILSVTISVTHAS
jgi:hypothetical protein